jgi:hypothetical protein
MALSDSCFEFLHAGSTAADELARNVHHYSDPQGAFVYGWEIDALRRACAAAAETPDDPEAGAGLLRLAATVMAFHDSSRQRGDIRPRVRNEKAGPPPTDGT